LADFVIKKNNDKRRAIDLINIAIGHREVYFSLFDVKRLADLLNLTEAPFAFWADWCSIFLLHIKIAHSRPKWFEEIDAPQIAVQWAIEQNNESEFVLRDVLNKGPQGLLEFLYTISPHFGMSRLQSILCKLFKNSGPGFIQAKLSNNQWWQIDSLRFRYFWHDMITEYEQTMLLNGDWAMFNTPTKDYSMALAQWWRVLESILKRGIVQELSTLFHQHPGWEEWDRKNLSKKKRTKEEVFLKLANPIRAKKMTLGDMLLVLKKCYTQRDGSKTGGSRLRLEAIRHLRKYDNQLQPLIEKDWLNPNYLTQENINLFRNKASHDAIITLQDAMIGRTIAKRAIDVFYSPALKNLNFVPHIVI